MGIQKCDHPSKAEKRLSTNMLAQPHTKASSEKFYNFLIINATSQKAHPRRKKAYPAQNP